MGLFDDLLSGGKESAAKRLKKGQQRAMEEAQSAWGDEQGYLNPQLQAFGGQSAMQAMLDPNAFYSQIMSGYEMSPAARRQMGEEQEAARNAAAAAGMSGSTDAMQNAGRLARDFSAQDMQQYFQNQMGIFGGGMGVGNNLAQFRDLLGQRRAQGQIGMSQANAMQALGRANNLQQGLGFAFGNMFNPGAQGQGGQGGQGNMNALMQLAQMFGG